MQNIRLIDYTIAAGDITYPAPDWAALKAAGYYGVALPASHDCHDNPWLSQHYASAKAAGLDVMYYIKITDGKNSYGAQVNDLKAKLAGRTWTLPACVMITGDQALTGHQLRGDLEFCLTDFLTRRGGMLALNRSSYGQLFNTDVSDAGLPAFSKLVSTMRLWWFAWGADAPEPPHPWTAITVWGRGEQDNVTEWGEEEEPEPEPEPTTKEELLALVDELRKRIEAL